MKVGISTVPWKVLSKHVIRMTHSQRLTCSIVIYTPHHTHTRLYYVCSLVPRLPDLFSKRSGSLGTRLLCLVAGAFNTCIGREGWHLFHQHTYKGGGAYCNSMQNHTQRKTTDFVDTQLNGDIHFHPNTHNRIQGSQIRVQVWICSAAHYYMCCWYAQVIFRPSKCCQVLHRESFNYNEQE